MQTDDSIQISEPTVYTDVAVVPPGKRLRIALEALPVGQAFTFRSAMERQHIHNVIAKTRKNFPKRRYTTRRVQPLDAEGKHITRIVRMEDEQ